MKPDVKIKQKDTNVEVSLELLAENIKALSEIGKKLNNSKLKQRTICLLLRDMTNVPMNQIQAILESIPLLEKKYLK